MRVGVHIDAFNLYYGGRALCGRGAAGWRWLDVRALVTPYVGWSGASVEKVVYCTARVNDPDHPQGAIDQAVYIDALLEAGSITELVEGRYVHRASEAPLAVSPGPVATKYAATGREHFDAALPLRHTTDRHSGRPMILATVQRSEEKGFDVNVAATLLRDVLGGNVEAAVVVSNDSDLAMPLELARRKVPVGLINPSSNYLAGALRGRASDGAGRHWWKQLTAAEFVAHQLPDPVGRWRKPNGW